LDYLHRIGNDRKKQAAEYALCLRDVVHWATHWAWTYDPREPISLIPFEPWAKQADFLNWLGEREKLQEDGLAEKSRDTGVTWLCCAFAVHRWLFRDGYQCGFGSRKLEYVDKRGDPKCIFEKIRFLIDNLPKWMLPQGFRREEHSAYAKLSNPANGASITGEGGDNIGRGGRSTVYFVDEAAFLEHPAIVDRALSQTTRCRIDVSTPNGPGTPFATKRFSGKCSVFIFDWRDDPRKNEFIVRDDVGKVMLRGHGERPTDLPVGYTAIYPWYEEQKRRFDPVTVAQEIDRDHSASVEGICIPGAWVRAAVNLKLPDVQNDQKEWIHYVPQDAGVCALDISEEGKDKNVLTHRRGPIVSMPIAWSQCNTTETAHRAAELVEKMGATALNYDCVGVGAGVRGALMTFEKKLKFMPNAINTGEKPSLTSWKDGKTSQERFVNQRAELWGFLRARFEKAYEFAELGIAHPPEEMITIPNCPELIADLSLPLWFRTETGKMKLESKEKMRLRGIKSPDYGDSLAMLFAPVRPFDPPSVIARPAPPNPYDRWSQRQPGGSAAEARGLYGRGGRAR